MMVAQWLKSTTKGKGLTTEPSNNMPERLQGSFRERAKVLSGIQILRSGQSFLDGWVINYNLFRPHEGLGAKGISRRRTYQAAVQGVGGLGAP